MASRSTSTARVFLRRQAREAVGEGVGDAEVHRQSSRPDVLPMKTSSPVIMLR